MIGPLFTALIRLDLTIMSEPIDIAPKNLRERNTLNKDAAASIKGPSTSKLAPSHDGPRGALSRFLFTLAIATAICLAVISFLYILGRSTQDIGPRLNVEQRSMDVIYADAVSIPQKALRLRALRNYISAFPEASQNTLASTLIDALETDEYDKWLSLSDIFYTTSSSAANKLSAIDTFEAEWGAGSYSEDVKAMRIQLQAQPEAPPAQERRLTMPKTTAAENDAQADITPQDASALNQYMAGAAPEIEIFKPAALLPTAPLQPVIIAAKITKDVEPTYPSRARSRGIEAVVTIAMDIDAKGEVKDAYIVKPATGRYANDFGRAAIRAAKSTQFSPKTINSIAEPTNGFTRRYRFEMSD